MLAGDEGGSVGSVVEISVAVMTVTNEQVSGDPGKQSLAYI